MPDQQAHTVLFVDDEHDMRKLVSFILARQGYRVLTAADGEEGLATIKKEHPHVVLLDLMMPKMNGHEVLRRLKADPAIDHIPVVVLTALGASKDVTMSRELGAMSHLEKPYQAQALFHEIEQGISKHQCPSSSPPAPPSNP